MSNIHPMSRVRHADPTFGYLGEGKVLTVGNGFAQVRWANVKYVLERDTTTESLADLLVLTPAAGPLAQTTNTREDGEFGDGVTVSTPVVVREGRYYVDENGKYIGPIELTADFPASHPYFVQGMVGRWDKYGIAYAGGRFGYRANLVAETTDDTRPVSLPSERLDTLNPAQALTGERKNTHGDWLEQSRHANELHAHFRELPNWANLPAYQQEALDMIATKISRIGCGDPNEPDHWDDIAGYAYLGKSGRTKG